MTRYVALLRGINVGGHNKVPMAELRALFAELGHAGARSYIQSGNVVFDADEAPEPLRAKLEAAVAERFDVANPIMLRDRGELEAIVAANPFAGRDLDPKKVTVSFLSGALSGGEDLAVPEGMVEEIVAARRELYVYYPDGLGRTRLDSAFFARRLRGASATVRNWRTVEKLRDMMGE
ncbi:MAG TPA: DUF1697 domain-containing protein [Stackebrandtia sp.]|jgi:uncharacterized protein (DUF1697 family)|uniref:DUF1697 domain-containing protein n=1 Tax=Stackebrandtia sp. TaxID=2023065 RepID=UPI002D59AC91|nr:DUF1697 domain-containing protein [Stackebrandtia sp.]HZE41922.1 DUF1697 domain-containing protein [Stackebrandtia sp.]